MARILLTLRYDGTAYHGWQVQPNALTVQECLQNAVEKVTGVRSGITGCSRTDAGVHATMFCCCTDTDSPLRGEKLCHALNFYLPRDISVYEARQVPAEFHPRYHALGKEYVYRIWNGTQRHPFYNRTAWHIREKLDAEYMNRLAQLYVGTHDFAAFCSADSDVQGSTCRTVRSCTVERQNEVILFRVEADGFLYNMVRIMVGTLTEIAQGRRDPSCIEQAFSSLSRDDAGITAPPHGLCLEKVFYDENNM